MEIKEYLLECLSKQVTKLINNNKSMHESISYVGNYKETNERYKITLIEDNEFRLEKIEYIINQLKEFN